MKYLKENKYLNVYCKGILVIVEEIRNVMKKV
jgi:hypothetical protein